MAAFRDDFLRRVGVAKESVMLDVIGHSMEPMIRHKDTILVDQSVKELRDRTSSSWASGRSCSSARPAHRAVGCRRKPHFSDIVVEGPISKPSVSRAGTLVRAGRLRAPFQRKAPATRLSRLTGGVPPPRSPKPHIPECGPRNSEARAASRHSPVRTPSFGGGGIALWAQPPALGRSLPAHRCRGYASSHPRCRPASQRT
ncbi:MAG: hypothetical protein ACLR7Z_12425 [Bilophila wadsworthia]